MSWEQKFTEAISEIKGDIGYLESSNKLRTLIKTKLLTFTDL